MKSYNKRIAIGCASVLTAALLSACSSKADSGTTEAAHEEPAAAMTNRIDLPLAARNNLGIRFVKAESRRLAVEKRYPGVVELLPGAKVPITAPLAGKVKLLGAKPGPVAAGEPLFDIEAPALAELCTKLLEARATMARASADKLVAQRESDSMQPLIAAAKAHLDAASAMRDSLSGIKRQLEADLAAHAARVSELEQLQAQGAGRASELADARAAQRSAAIALAAHALEAQGIEVQAQAAIVEHEQVVENAKVKALAADRAGTVEHYTRSIYEDVVSDAGKLLSRLGFQFVPTMEQDKPWEHIPSALTVRAPSALTITGVAVADGAWVEAGAEACSVVLAGKITTRIAVPAADATKFAAASKARLRGSDQAQAVQAKLERAPESSSAPGMVDFLVRPQAEAAWLTPGTSAIVEVTLAETGDAEVVVPRAAIIQDGLEFILFRRDPANPDKVIRLAADIGLMRSDFVSLRSGVAQGDELVTDGIYELKLMGQGKAAAGGHFHADGTFHAGPH